MTDTAPDVTSAEFAALTDQFRPELLAYCYRMLGSVHDAEDQVQEIMLRAWRARSGFEGRASLRTWLYRIAVNVCLRALETRSRRPLPSGLGDPARELAGPLLPGDTDVPWLQPIPDALVAPASSPADPAAEVASRAGMRLALIAALQYLPPRQRAVLILRDVLAWPAADVARLLGTTTVAVNSALQRARTQMAQAAPAEDEITEPADPAVRALLDQYATAFQTADVAALTKLLHVDASMEMPPVSLWVAGRDGLVRFLAEYVLGAPGDWRMVPTSANGQPALAAYLRTASGEYHGHGINVLTVRPGGISHIVSFLDPSLFPAFALPSVLPGQR